MALYRKALVQTEISNAFALRLRCGENFLKGERMKVELSLDFCFDGRGRFV